MGAPVAGAVHVITMFVPEFALIGVPETDGTANIVVMMKAPEP
jgi:hypothetical protein